MVSSRVCCEQVTYRGVTREVKKGQSLSEQDILAWKQTGHWHEAFCTGDIIVPVLLKSYEEIQYNVTVTWAQQVYPRLTEIARNRPRLSKVTRDCPRLPEIA